MAAYHEHNKEDDQKENVKEWINAGFPEQSAKLWSELGLTVEEAKEYNENFTYVEAEKWVKSGFISVAEAKKWYNAGFSPYEAHFYKNLDIGVELAISLKQTGTTEHRLRKLYESYHASPDKLYSALLEGWLKWKFETHGSVKSMPAIDLDGTIYLTSKDSHERGYLYAIDPSGTLKWKFEKNCETIFSPMIGSDGTIYVVSNGPYSHSEICLHAINSDGRIKWNFWTEGWDEKSTPAIGLDRTIYLLVKEFERVKTYTEP